MVTKGINEKNINNILNRWVVNRLVCVLFMFVLSVPLFAQACCSGGVPLGGSLGLGAADSKSLQALLTYDYNAMNDLVSASKNLDDQTRSRTTQSSMLEVNYGFNPRFSVTGVVPYVRQARTIQGVDGSQDITVAQGLGDVVLMAKYRLLDPAKQLFTDWVVGAGPKLPTGKTDFTNNQGLALTADMQPGSGSLDWILWSYFSHNRIKDTDLGIMAVTMFRYSGVNDTYNGTQAYRFGHEFQLSLGLTYNTLLVRPMDVFASMRYRKQSEDLVDGNVFPSSGGEWVYLIPGIHINLFPNTSLRLSGDIPVYRRLEGTQLTTSYKLTAALLFTIPFNNQV